MHHVLSPLLGHQAWANAALLATLARLDPDTAAGPRAAAVRLMGHIAIVEGIFQAHLRGVGHEHTTDMPATPPVLAALTADLAALDRWYQDFLAAASEAELAEAVAFRFTDGQRGRMSRAEILTHVALHGALHRGEVGRLVAGLGVPLPWDTLAVFLHDHEPERRLHP